MSNVKPRSGGPYSLFCTDCGCWVPNTANYEMRKEGVYSYSHTCRNGVCNMRNGEKKEMSKVGKQMLAFQARLAEEHHYEPLSQISMFDGDVREKYIQTLPEWCKISGDVSANLSTLDGTVIATGYERIVIGDYGAFIEISPQNIVKSVLCCKQGQEYRYKDPNFVDRVKYLWLTAKDKSDCKIYFQKKTVDYADYVPGMYYISPFEVFSVPQTCTGDSHN